MADELNLFTAFTALAQIVVGVILLVIGNSVAIQIIGIVVLLIGLGTGFGPLRGWVRATRRAADP